MSWAFINGPNCSAVVKFNSSFHPHLPSFVLKKCKEAVSSLSYVADFIINSLRSLWAQHVLGLHPLIKLLGGEVAKFNGGGLQRGPVFVCRLSNLGCLVIP